MTKLFFFFDKIVVVPTLPSAFKPGEHFVPKLTLLNTHNRCLLTFGLFNIQIWNVLSLFHNILTYPWAFILEKFIKFGVYCCINTRKQIFYIILTKFWANTKCEKYIGRKEERGRLSGRCDVRGGD